MHAALWRELTRNTLGAKRQWTGGWTFFGIPPNELKYMAHIAFDGYTAFVKDERERESERERITSPRTQCTPLYYYVVEMKIAKIVQDRNYIAARF